MTNKKIILILLILSIATHFAFFGHPKETVFDEVHFGKFVSGYYTGEYYFDIHPPLGKLMIAGFAKIFDFQPKFSFAQIGEEFPDKKYMALRFLPTFAGTLLPLVIFLLILELGMSRIAAFAGGLLIVFENALLTQSRFILLDPFLFLFGFTSLLLYLKYLKHPQTYSQILKNLRIGFKFKRTDLYLIWAAVFAGLAVSIKWTGLSFIALPILIESFGRFTKLSYDNFVKLLKFMGLYGGIALAIYFSVFALHFVLLPKPGPGDAFMSSGFREAGVISKFVELNREMYASNQRLSATHPYSSSWYQWPFGSKPIFYWVKDGAKIYLQGNPVIWLGSTIAVVIGLWTMAYGLWLKLRKKSFELSSIVPRHLAILITGYWLNVLPFIGIKRVMFLYHYLIPLIFAILVLVYWIDQTKNRQKIFAGLIIASIAAFIYFAPLTYGLPYSQPILRAFW